MLIIYWHNNEYKWKDSENSTILFGHDWLTSKSKASAGLPHQHYGCVALSSVAGEPMRWLACYSVKEDVGRWTWWCGNCGQQKKPNEARETRNHSITLKYSLWLVGFSDCFSLYNLHLWDIKHQVVADSGSLSSNKQLTCNRELFAFYISFFAGIVLALLVKMVPGKVLEGWIYMVTKNSKSYLWLQVFNIQIGRHKCIPLFKKKYKPTL